ncbi:hypothetical protein [Allochromatium vinosum]|uniref:Uncharacterized protein n=1 Tax=Allochromatium vinosum (strain ATCC 17899 / DSM 180 / NBRC 103801 / NCIMB 10441 / D) TaxID=572477 RepID=D3RWE8_ALLVD|nr:hypothetical protein [Allochromatium vinosum]ADC64160.1 hypothetical protein Alvin_3269 [Allochromatium vinosum DSM 180]
MQNNPITNAIEGQLIHTFGEYLNDFFHTTHFTHWRKGVLNTLCKYGHQLGCQVFTSKALCPQAEGEEWIYDLHWRAANESSRLVRLPLVMQMEDFQDQNPFFHAIITQSVLKLAHARADTRLLVLGCRDTQRTLDHIYNTLEQFEHYQAGDRYVFALWDFNINPHANKMQVFLHHR